MRKNRRSCGLCLLFTAVGLLLMMPPAVIHAQEPEYSPTENPDPNLKNEEESGLYTQSSFQPQQTGSSWQTLDGITKYLGQNGLPVKGWNKLEGSWFYFEPSTGNLKTGLQIIDGNTYYLEEKTGVMQTGLVTLPDGTVSFFDTDGIRRTGWRKIQGSWHYFDRSDGSMLTGHQQIDSRWYYLEPATGSMHTGELRDENGLLFYHADGARCSGWLKQNNQWFYHDPASGTRLYGDMTLNGKEYRLDSRSGQMYTGWLKQADGWVYYGEDGDKKYGFAQVHDEVCRFDEQTGLLKTGTFTIGHTTYVTNGDGFITRTTINSLQPLMQTDPRWSSPQIKGFSIYSTGCVPTVMTMAVNTLMQTSYTPP